MTKHDLNLSAPRPTYPTPIAVEWLEAYYQPAKREAVKLRDLDPLEQMFAYYEA